MSMLLTDAVRLVVADTWENTDPSLTRIEAVAVARTLTAEDLTVVDSAELKEAYRMVLAAGTEQLGLALLD